MTRALSSASVAGLAIAVAIAAMLGRSAQAQPSPSDPPISIIGGTATTPGEYPNVVALVVGSNLCTGTLITPVWVVTAAHCVDPMVLGFATQADVTAAMTVHFNTLDVVGDPGTAIGAVTTIKDAAFNAAHLGSGDIGLIELERPVTDVTPAQVNFANSMVPVGTMVTTVGYGATSTDSSGTVGTEFELPGRVTVPCPSLGIGSDTNLLCFSQTDGSGTCEGDSGGPSFAVVAGELQLVGVTSFGDQQCAMFGAATRPGAEQSFLLSNVPDLAECSSDSNCSLRQTCFAHRCFAQPFSPTGLGTICTAAQDCESLECAQSSQDGSRCSFACSVSDSLSCPDGFECLRETGDVGACWPVDNSGCCDAGGTAGPGAIALSLGVTALVLRRRRR